MNMIGHIGLYKALNNGFDIDRLNKLKDGESLCVDGGEIVCRKHHAFDNACKHCCFGHFRDTNMNVCDKIDCGPYDRADRDFAYFEFIPKESEVKSNPTTSIDWDKVLIDASIAYLSSDHHMSPMDEAADAVNYGKALVAKLKEAILQAD